MEFPHGHHTHRHHRREEANEEEEYPPPPLPPSYYGEDAPPPPPPPQVTNVYHTSHVPPAFTHPFPPPDHFNSSPFPPPPPPPYFSITNVQHVSHDPVRPNAPIESETHQQHHHFSPHLPSSLPHHAHSTQLPSHLSTKPTFRIFCKADPGYSLTIRDDKVILAPSHPSDHLQHWYKDDKYSTRVRDDEGSPGFVLVNRVTGQAMKHSIGATHPQNEEYAFSSGEVIGNLDKFCKGDMEVQLIPYNPDVLDVSILWTLSKDLGDGFKTIRMVNNIHLNVDAFQGDKNHGGIHDNTTIVLWDWKKGDNQRWKIIPYCKSWTYEMQTNEIPRKVCAVFCSIF